MANMLPHCSPLPHTPRPWRDAWADAATAAGGFWLSNQPRQHFRTAATTTDLLAGMITSLLLEHPRIEAVVELGAGNGELLAGLQDRGSQLSLTGVDLRRRPTELPESVGWFEGRWDVSSASWTSQVTDLLAALDRPTLLLAVEWLDDLPCQLAVRAGSGWRIVEVGTDGEETLGSQVDGIERQWMERWWPDGDRVEIGLTRETAWTAALAALTGPGGIALMIDYGHLLRRRPTGGTLTGYVGGAVVPPTVSPLVNLTAHVSVDALAAAGQAAGAHTDLLIPQREAVDRWLDVRPAGRDLLQTLVRRSERRALRETFGDQWWLLQRVDPVTGSRGAAC